MSNCDVIKPRPPHSARIKPRPPHTQSPCIIACRVQKGGAGEVGDGRKVRGQDRTDVQGCGEVPSCIVGGYGGVVVLTEGCCHH